ncbi:AAA family ATPase [Streptomyces luteolus]|uniref:AAA family ATPase n=1 Tax=Streptomyces luteolus TaxID=3043615 RepID=A0ABT6SV85_9ACTN|nr:AAA family ATPase [Streptomyces sp. B-S-A12]MDI3419523.1 AAA family ATPase [Streptomyces sp. B-S-A12]
MHAHPTTHNRLIILTGGPGSGKTTLIDALERSGLSRTEEAGRAVIREQLAIGGTALPWADQEAFATLMLERELRSYREGRAAPGDGPVLCDRGLPDLVGYLRLEGLPLPEPVHTAARELRYHPDVFIAPPWPEIYGRDTERKQSYEEAVRTYEVMAEVYPEYGYELVPLPLGTVDERVGFVRARLRERSGVSRP